VDTNGNYIVGPRNWLVYNENRGEFVNATLLEPRRDIVWANATSINNGTSLFYTNVYTNVSGYVDLSQETGFQNSSHISALIFDLRPGLSAAWGGETQWGGETLWFGTNDGKIGCINNIVYDANGVNSYDINRSGNLNTAFSTAFENTTSRSLSVTSVKIYSSQGLIATCNSDFGESVKVLNVNSTGTGWENRTGDLPDVSVWGCEALSDDRVLLATELGVWETTEFTNAEPRWTRVWNGMRDQRVNSIYSVEKLSGGRTGDVIEKTIVASTFGTGTWTLDAFTDVADPDINGDGVVDITDVVYAVENGEKVSLANQIIETIVQTPRLQLVWNPGKAVMY